MQLKKKVTVNNNVRTNVTNFKIIKILLYSLHEHVECPDVEYLAFLFYALESINFKISWIAYTQKCIKSNKD